jgi:dimethylaniline monooxygenase (N-oxide forming)
MAVTSIGTVNTPQQRRIAIVGGGGISGLQTIRALKARGLQVTAYEGGSKVGGIWKSNYSNFSVQVPRVLFEFQDFPMHGLGWNDYATGVQVQDYMERYSEAFGLLDSIQFNAYVTRVRQQPDQTWTLEVTVQGQSTCSIEHFDFVIIASGLYSATNQFIPSIPGKESFHGEIVHSCQFYDASLAKGKRVVVIGGGKSAVDIAVEAAIHNASKVTLLPREMHWPSPRVLLGLIPTHNILMSRFGAALVCTQSGTFPTGGVLSTKSRLLSILTKPIYKLYEILVAWQFNLWGKLYPKTQVMRDFYNIHYSVNDDLTKMRKKGKVDLKEGEIVQFKEDGSTLALKDGSTLLADLVVSATGFQEDYSIFEDPKKLLDLQDDGVYMYRFMLPQNVQNIAFIGHVNAVSNIGCYGLQAEWLARYLAGDLVEEPTPEKMKKDIEARKVWARNFMPMSKVRGMTILLHQTHYWDCLLSDMGVSPYRKRNILAEYLMPYGPSDYNGIIGLPKPKKITSRWF